MKFKVVGIVFLATIAAISNGGGSGSKESDKPKIADIDRLKKRAARRTDEQTKKILELNLLELFAEQELTIDDVDEQLIERFEFIWQSAEEKSNYGGSHTVKILEMREKYYADRRALIPMVIQLLFEKDDPASA